MTIEIIKIVGENYDLRTRQQTVDRGLVVTNGIREAVIPASDEAIDTVLRLMTELWNRGEDEVPAGVTVHEKVGRAVHVAPPAVEEMVPLTDESELEEVHVAPQQPVTRRIQRPQSKVVSRAAGIPANGGTRATHVLAQQPRHSEAYQDFEAALGMMPTDDDDFDLGETYGDPDTGTESI